MGGAVRVRFAPSPTGHLHVGGARTALFNWLYARHHRGAFVLRVEDTDRARSTDEDLAAILEALEWLGLDWDEGPPTPGYRQSERLPIYREHAERLRAAGRAYYCDCPPELLERERQAAQKRKETFRYSGRCRDRGLERGALRLRIPDTGATVVNDLIHGPVTFDHGQLDDWILVRTDGTPTYNFCVVVDDVTMRITHVIRGNDHLSNTPKQILCYEALGYPVPGWSHGDQEIFTREELIEFFDIKDVAASGAIFDETKLEWLSHEYLKRQDGAALATLALPFIRAAGLEPPEPARLAPMLDTLKERAKTLVELVAAGRFYFEPPAAYEPQAAATYLTVEGARRLEALIARLEAEPDWSAAALERVYRATVEALSLKLVDLAQLSRLAVTGGTASPPLFEVLALLGRDEVLRRLRRARGVAEGRG